MGNICNVFMMMYFLLVSVLYLGGITVSSVYADCTEPLILMVPETVSAGSSNSISVSGGEQPYTWSACGKGYSVEHAQTSTGDNTLYASEEIGCSYGIVTVKDSCGQTAEKSVRGDESTGGQWVEEADYDGTCVISGKAEDYQVSGLTYRAIQGDYLLTQSILGYETAHNCTNDKCDPCCQECSPLPQKEQFSCFSGWYDYLEELCPSNRKENETCYTSFAVVTGDLCHAVTGCGEYRVTRCLRHVKRLYKWSCDDPPNECGLSRDDNLGEPCQTE